MDGVLIEAKEWHYEALNRALELFGMKISRHDHLSTYDGLPTKRKLELLSLETDLPTGLHDFINEMKQQYTTDIIHAQCRPTFCHEYALARLKADGYRLGLASNSVRRTVELMMEKAHLSAYLDVTLSNQDVARGKPDPEIYLLAMNRLGVRAEECLVVEDNPNGVRAARDAGAHVLVVKEVTEVNYANLSAAIARANEELAS